MRVRRDIALEIVHPQPAEADSVVARLRRGLAEAGLDCECRDKANAVLDGFDAELLLRRRAEALADARRMRDAIVIVLALLAEVDEITPEEPDATAFDELASLFGDISDFAATGAEAMRHLLAGAAVQGRA